MYTVLSVTSDTFLQNENITIRSCRMRIILEPHTASYKECPSYKKIMLNRSKHKASNNKYHYTLTFAVLYIPQNNAPSSNLKTKVSYARIAANSPPPDQYQ